LVKELPEVRHHMIDFLSCEREEEILPHAARVLKACDRRAVLVGWSMGAIVALKLASLYPERIGALFLIAGTERFVREEKGEPGWDGRALKRMTVQLARNPQRVLADFDRQLFSSAEIERGLHAIWRERFRSVLPPVSSLMAGLGFLKNVTVDVAAVPLAIRTFLLTGEEDAICFPEAARQLARRLPQSQLQIWEGTGHVPFFAEPERFLAWLRKGVGIDDR
jgi:pimeloyl-[acyl-carrier protein] methyl ester esterase